MNALAKMPEPTKLFDTDIEQALIGAVLNDNRHLDSLNAIKALDFYDALHQRLWGAIFEKYDANEKANYVNVAHSMLGDDLFAQAGGAPYLKSIVKTAMGSGFRNVADYGRIVSDLKLRREIEVATQQARELLQFGDTPLIEVVRPILDMADIVTERAAGLKPATGAGDSAFAALEGVERARKSDRPAAAPSGVAALDEIIGGLYGGDLLIVAGRPGMGKSSLATTIARAAGQAGRPVEFFSLEMTSHQLSVRLACDLDYDGRLHDHPLSYSRLLKGRASHPEMERAYTAAARLRELPITIHDRDSASMQDIASIARSRAARAQRQGVIIIDHLQIVAATNRYRGNRVQEITESTGLAKGLAKRLNWPVVLLSQMSREVEKRNSGERRPTLADLRDSGSIEQDADIVIGMYRPAYYLESSRPALRNADPKWAEWSEDYEIKKHDLDLIVLKNRNGPTETVAAFCDMRSSVIRDRADAAPNDAGQGLLV